MTQIEKQIEEMAVVLKFCKDTSIETCHTKKSCSHCIAEQIYNAGYRKQSEGVWIHDINNLYGCSNCFSRSSMSPKNKLPYCPYCGARMKGA